MYAYYTQILYMSLLALLSSCATLHTTPGFYAETKELSDLVENYRIFKLAYLKTPNTNYPIVIRFTDKGYPEVAKCYREDNESQRDVIININHWNTLSKPYKLELLFHELGHCDLNYDHQDDVVGIMNTTRRIEVLNGDHLRNFFNKTRL